MERGGGAGEGGSAGARLPKLASTPPTAHICTPDEAASVWYVRESALGAVVFVPGEPNRWEGWEDAAVPPEKLGGYLRSISTLMGEYGYTQPAVWTLRAGLRAHAHQLRFPHRGGSAQFREFLDRATDVVLEFGGSLSGEHGDGQARAALLPKMFGPELMQAFREFKALWDPDNRMNPGKLMDAVRVYDPIENLRHGIQCMRPMRLGTDRRTATQRKSSKHILLSLEDGGSLERATERCVGVGACRKTEAA